MENPAHIAVVDDHEDIRELVGRYLGERGYRVSVADGGDTLRKLVQTDAPDLIVLDIMMPGDDGLEICRELRATSQIPVIFLTAMAEDTDRIIGLEIGGDDYLIKPFNPRELLARIKAVLRRTQQTGSSSSKAATLGKRLRFDDKIVDVARHEIIGSDGVTIALSNAEFRLLSVFLKHPGTILSRDQLLDLTSGRTADVWDRTIDNQVSRLRRKVEEDPAKPTLIKTCWGDGYQFTAEVENL